MNKKTGVELLKIAAFLYAMRYVTAALFMGPGLNNWNADLFEASYKYVGNGLTTWAFIIGIGGLIFLFKPSDKKNDA